MDLDLTNLTAALFLDAHERYAKRLEDVATVRLFLGAGLDEETVDLTAEEFAALPAEQKEQIRNTGSGAPFLDTAGKSNA